MKRYSKQFPNKVRPKTQDRSLGTLLYTLPMTGEIRAVSGCIGVKYPIIANRIKDMVCHGYVKDNFSKPVYVKEHELLPLIR